MTTDENNPTTVSGMTSALNQHSDGTNLIQESIQTFSNPDGSNKKGDAILYTQEKAFQLLQQLIVQKQTEASKSTTNPKKKAKMISTWNFRTSPHEEFDKTLNDLFLAFLVWAKIKDEDKVKLSLKEDGEYFNVSKAFRRLESYAKFMEDTGEELINPPLTKSSVQSCIEAWAMTSSIDNQGRHVWWIDFAQIDQATLHERYTVTESFRACVYFAHQVMYDANAQSNGMVFVENVNKIGFVDALTLRPMKLSTKVDRLAIGVLPIRMVACYILDMPKWMNVFMKLMGVFMSSKMKNRIHNVDDRSTLKNLLGIDCIPASFQK